MKGVEFMNYLVEPNSSLSQDFCIVQGCGTNCYGRCEEQCVVRCSTNCYGRTCYKATMNRPPVDKDLNM